MHTLRRNKELIWLCLFIVALVAFFTAVVIIDNKSDERNYRANIAKVEQFCGHDRAQAFAATHSAGNPSSYEDMQKWVEACSR